MLRRTGTGGACHTLTHTRAVGNNAAQEVSLDWRVSDSGYVCARACACVRVRVCVDLQPLQQKMLVHDHTVPVHIALSVASIIARCLYFW